MENNQQLIEKQNANMPGAMRAVMNPRNVRQDKVITCVDCGNKVTCYGSTNECDCGRTYGVNGQGLNRWWNQTAREIDYGF
jgi:hypothetical protein